MGKLYYTPTSCGAATFISAHIGELNLETEKVDLYKHLCSTGDFYSVNPKGNVPTLILDDGTLLNENVGTLLYVMDNANNTKLSVASSAERSIVVCALSYIASEFHGIYALLFNPACTEEARPYLLARLATKYKYLNDTMIGSKEYLVAGHLTVADIYLYIAFTWGAGLKFDISPYPNVEAFLGRISALPEVVAARARMLENPPSVF